METAIRLLSHVPPHNWTRHAYLPARGAWSLKLESCNTPEELLEILRAALEEVVRWPATVAATLAKRKEDDEEEEGEWMIHTCFACGERSEQGEDSRDHPYIRELLLCVACFQRFSVVSWDCDSDLLGFRCYACGFEGAVAKLQNPPNAVQIIVCSSPAYALHAIGADDVDHRPCSAHRF